MDKTSGKPEELNYEEMMRMEGDRIAKKSSKQRIEKNAGGKDNAKRDSQALSEEDYEELSNCVSRRVTLENFNIVKLIGKGSFGKVFLVTSRSSKNFYAMKALKKDIVLQDDDVECTMLERDVCKLGSRNPYLTKLFCTFQNAEYLFFLMEFLNGGDLMFHIVESRKFSEERARFYAAEILCGLQFLHDEGIIYR